MTLTVPRAARTGQHRSGGVVQHAADVPGEHVVSRFGIQVTTAARTVADLSRTATFMEAVVIADSALRGRLATKAELRRVLGYCARWPGVEQARRAAGFSHPLAESVLESCARVVFHAHGLPRPALQVNIGGREFIGRVDFCWMAHQTVAEADGLLKYQGRAEAIAELRRDRLLREAGFEVVHLTWREVFGEPDRVVARIREAFERARRLRG